MVSCSTNSTSSQDDSGLFGTVAALNSGAYDKELAKKRHKLAQLQAQNKQSKQRQTELEHLERQKQRQLQQLQSKANVSARKNALLKGNIRDLSRQLQIVKLEQQKQQNDIALLNYENNRNAFLNTEQKSKLNSLLIKRNRLRKQLEELLNKKI
jgi:HAMP domain-containing protein